MKRGKAERATVRLAGRGEERKQGGMCNKRPNNGRVASSHPLPFSPPPTPSCLSSFFLS